MKAGSIALYRASSGARPAGRAGAWGGAGTESSGTDVVIASLGGEDESRVSFEVEDGCRPARNSVVSLVSCKP